MARDASSNDFNVQVDGLGTFVFGRRTMRDEFAIAAEYSRLTEGVATLTDWLHYFARAFSTIRTLQVKSPDGWDVEKLDPQEEASYAQIMGVFDALRAAEADFRKKPGKPG